MKSPTARPRSMITRVLLVCGIAYTVLYTSMMVFVRWNGYSRFSQVVSELSAWDAPTRSLWMKLGIVYTALVIAFAIGVLASTGGNRRLRVVGVALLVDGIFGAYWPPMHLREVLAARGGTITDTLHVAVWTPVTAILFMLAMGFGAFAFGKRFRLYSFASIAVLIIFGAMTAAASRGISANRPTPWVGVWERVNIAAFMLWVALFAITMLRRESSAAAVTGRQRTGTELRVAA